MRAHSGCRRVLVRRAIGYAGGAAVMGEQLAALVLGGLGFATGSLGWAALDPQAHRDEHPRTWKP